MKNWLSTMGHVIRRINWKMVFLIIAGAVSITIIAIVAIFGVLLFLEHFDGREPETIQNFNKGIIMKDVWFHSSV
ncbi:hypothetical protein J2R98_001545 [Alkalibacillus filiformis]|uniref:Uncharacterized protein n=1 Tax=Alkalibacillus filiformis TaxID=200990 RepID=A0ABU0DTE2_9BACI|nr:hypothetical protein [Alkalibacillus filiformis]MDQ0351728.1 hypothetical protein [Alkalibacillus filiformis]